MTMARRGEVVKLERVLGGKDLGYLDALDAAGLHALREALSAILFDDAKPVLQRVATASKLLPVSLVAKVGERVFGATLCAQVTGLLAPSYALDLALRMSNPFLASVSAMIDPRSAGKVVAAIPADRIIAVAAVLIERGDFVTMARFVDYLSPATIGAVIESVANELHLLQIGAYVESRTKLRELIGQLALERTRKMLAALRGTDADRWLEALAIAEALDDESRGKLGDIAAELEPEVMRALIAVAKRHGVWESALMFADAMSEVGKRKFFALVHEATEATEAAEAGTLPEAWTPTAGSESFPGSLCRRCTFVRLVQATRSEFIMCTEPTLPKYGPQPVRACRRFVPA